MKILVFNLNSYYHLFCSTTIMREFSDADFVWVVRGDDYKNIFKYNKRVSKTYTLDNFLLDNISEYDLIINLDASLNIKEFESLKGKDFLGFNYGADDSMRDILNGIKNSSKNIFQIYYNVINRKWKGQGYDFYYRPRSSQNKDIGVYISDSKIYGVIDKYVDLSDSSKEKISDKNTFLKKVEQINKFRSIITDDILYVNIASFLGKDIHFLNTGAVNTKVELFGNGSVYKIPRGLSLWI